MPQLFSLSCERFDQRRMRMTESANGDAARQVHVVPALFVPDARALRAHGYHRYGRIDGGHDGIEGVAGWMWCSHWRASLQLEKGVAEQRRRRTTDGYLRVRLLWQE